MNTLRKLTLFSVAWFGCAGIAAAQDGEAGWRITLGAGALYAPAYEGADEYRLSLLPDVQVDYGERFFASVQQGVGYRWISEDSVRAGPIARVNFGRPEDGDQAFAISGEDTSDLRGLGDVDASIEVGGFAEYETGIVTLRVEARRAVNGHDGLVADVGARWSGRAQMLGAPLLWSMGPRARFVDEAYSTAYFGVTPAQSIASGLPVFSAGAGLHSFGLGGNVIVPLSEGGQWALVAVAGYDRLEGDAGSSPLVQLRGDQDQASLGLFISRRF